jgi:hypothetical protein
LLSGDFARGDTVLVDIEDDQVVFTRKDDVEASKDKKKSE